MVIISKGIIHAFAGKHPKAIPSLNDWYQKAKLADWKNHNEMSETFNSVDTIGNDRYVFNISGNSFRLIAMVHFSIRTMYIRGIYKHAEYDFLNKTGKLLSL
jgi:mRNA interferase HigB